MVVADAQLSLTNSVIRDGRSSGLHIISADPVLTNNSYLNNTFAAISMDLDSNPNISIATMTGSATPSPI